VGLEKGHGQGIEACRRDSVGLVHAGYRGWGDIYGEILREQEEGRTQEIGQERIDDNASSGKANLRAQMVLVGDGIRPKEPRADTNREASRVLTADSILEATRPTAAGELQRPAFWPQEGSESRYDDKPHDCSTGGAREDVRRLVFDGDPAGRNLAGPGILQAKRCVQPRVGVCRCLKKDKEFIELPNWPRFPSGPWIAPCTGARA
jgi:hypothetical protein